MVSSFLSYTGIQFLQVLYPSLKLCGAYLLLTMVRIIEVYIDIRYLNITQEIIIDFKAKLNISGKLILSSTETQYLQLVRVLSFL